MEHPKGTAVCYGIAVCDVLIPGIPRDAFSEETTRIPTFHYSTGGDAMNAGVALVKLGHRAQLVSLVGHDLFGDYIVKQGETFGVDMDFVGRHDSLPTTVSLVCIHPDGERSFIVNRGADTAISAECFQPALLDEADILAVGSAFCVTDLTRTLTPLFRAAQERGVRTCVDVMRGPDPSDIQEAKRFFPFTDFLFPNYEEGCWLTGETDVARIGAKLVELGVGCAVVKTGRDGCHLFSQDGWHVHVPGFEIEDVKDTTGAGDHFAAGFIAALMEGKTPVECAEFANAVAACSIRYIGTTGLQGREEVEALLQTRRKV